MCLLRCATIALRASALSLCAAQFKVYSGIYDPLESIIPIHYHRVTTPYNTNTTLIKYHLLHIQADITMSSLLSDAENLDQNQGSGGAMDQSGSQAGTTSGGSSGGGMDADINKGVSRLARQVTTSADDLI